jgi:hypothetical protein
MIVTRNMVKFQVAYHAYSVTIKYFLLSSSDKQRSLPVLNARIILEQKKTSITIGEHKFAIMS